MEMKQKHSLNSPSSSSSSSIASDRNPNPNSNTNTNSGSNPHQSWWESITKARSRIHLLSTILSSFPPSISSLADSDRPARSLLESHEAYLSLSHSLSNPLSGSGDDPLCQWFYETFQSSDPDLRLVVLAFVPLITGLYLSRIINPNTSSNPNSLLTPSLSGFESVILSIYASEYKSRGGKPVLITMPDLSQPSLYHYPKGRVSSGVVSRLKPDVGVLCPPLEQQVGVKSTKRSFIVSVVLDCYYKQISQMPSWSKLELCEFVVKWAGKSCPCRSEFDSVGDNVLEIKDFEDDYKHEIEDGVVEEMSKFEIGEDSKVTSTRIPLPWELLQPVLRILGHCLLAPLISQDVKDAASVAVRCLYARASHELVPQAILATRSLIHLDKRGRAAAKAEADAITASNANTPIKGKPQNFLVSKNAVDVKIVTQMSVGQNYNREWLALVGTCWFSTSQ